MSEKWVGFVKNHVCLVDTQQESINSSIIIDYLFYLYSTTEVRSNIKTSPRISHLSRNGSYSYEHNILIRQDLPFY